MIVDLFRRAVRSLDSMANIIYSINNSWFEATPTLQTHKHVQLLEAPNENDQIYCRYNLSCSKLIIDDLWGGLLRDGVSNGIIGIFVVPLIFLSSHSLLNIGLLSLKAPTLGIGAPLPNYNMLNNPYMNEI